MVLEGSQLPEDWIAKANLLDQIWASSTYNKEMLEKNGVAVDIQVIWHGFDQETYYPKFDSAKYLYNARTLLEDPFTFGFCGGHTNPIDRKGGQWLAEAFNVFNKEDNVKLKFHINKSYNPSFPAEAHLRSLIKEELQDKVEYDDSFLTDKELAEWYRGLDVSVTPSAGEAFCMSILEAIACGTPVIVTDWSGYLDYTKPTEQMHTRIKRRFLAHYGQFDPVCGSVWVEPDVEHLKEQLRWAFEHPEEVKESGRKASLWVHEHMTWEKQAIKTREVVENYEKNTDSM